MLWDSPSAHPPRTLCTLTLTCCLSPPRPRGELASDGDTRGPGRGGGAPATWPGLQVHREPGLRSRSRASGSPCGPPRRLPWLIAAPAPRRLSAASFGPPPTHPPASSPHGVPGPCARTAAGLQPQALLSSWRALVSNYSPSRFCVSTQGPGLTLSTFHQTVLLSPWAPTTTSTSRSFLTTDMQSSSATDHIAACWEPLGRSLAVWHRGPQAGAPLLPCPRSFLLWLDASCHLPSPGSQHPTGQLARGL